jgi:N-acetylneuraminate synthase
MGLLRERYGVKVGWSDHTVSPAVMQRAVHRWNAELIEFHLDLDEQGAEYAAGHCWLPGPIEGVITDARKAALVDGVPIKALAPSEADDRDWRADPVDGLRPLKHMRALA